VSPVDPRRYRNGVLTPTRGPLRLIRALVVAGIAVLGTVVIATPASAHDALVSTSPADGSSVDAAPGAVELVFTEPPKALGTAVSVVGPDGRPVSDGTVELVGTIVRQHLLADRPAGRYTVEWRVTAADGHPTSGTFGFTALTATAAPVTQTTAAPAVPTLAPVVPTQAGGDQIAPAPTPATPVDNGGRPGIAPALGIAAAFVLVGGLAAGALLVRRHRR
jgi:methionine-rich copper-binding protein CopC